MSSSAVAMGRVAFAALIIGAAPAFAQQAQSSSEPGVVIVQPARVPVPGSPQAAERNANLRPPPPGPIESRLLPIPESGLRAPRDARSEPPAAASAAPPAVESSGQSASAPISGPIFATPPVQSMAAPSGPAVAASRPAEPAPSVPGAPLAVIGFAGQSANLTEATRAELDQRRQAHRRAGRAPDRAARLCHRRRHRQPQGGAGARPGRARLPDRRRRSRRASRSAPSKARAATSRSSARRRKRRAARRELGYPASAHSHPRCDRRESGMRTRRRRLLGLAGALCLAPIAAARPQGAAWPSQARAHHRSRRSRRRH